MVGNLNYYENCLFIDKRYESLLIKYKWEQQTKLNYTEFTVKETLQTVERGQNSWTYSWDNKKNKDLNELRP